MSSDLKMSCRCGKFHGVVRDVSGRAGNHLVCYCDDCQAFAEYLGRADEILDAHGGTDIFQVSPAHVQINAGHDSLACVRLGPKGLFRWFASCCKTPIGNTLPTHKIPFVGLIHSCLDGQGRSLDEVIGPVLAGVNGRYALGDRAAVDAHDKASFPVLLRVYRKLLLWRIRGDHKRSPFFDGAGAPVVTPSTRD